MTANAPARLTRRLVRLYPGPWRARYAEEMLDLLVVRPPTWSDVGDLALHLLYSHLHPDLALTGDESFHERWVLLMRTLRSSEVAVFCAFVASVVAWLQFGGLVDGGPYAPLVGPGDSWPLVRFNPGSGLSVAMAALSAAADLAFLAVLAGGLPLAIAAWRRAPHARRLFLVPVAGVVGAFLPVPIALLLVGPVATVNLTFATPITIAYFVWFVALAAVSTLALARAITASDLDERLVRFAFLPSVVVAGALLLMLGATMAWGVAAHLEAPQLFDRGELTLGHATLTSWGADVLVMATAALLAVLAVVRGATTSRTAAREA